MKKLLIITFTIFLLSNSVYAQDTKVSMNASVGIPHYGLRSLNEQAMACYSVLWHGQDEGIGIVGVGFEYNTAFKYKVDTMARIVHQHVPQIMFGFAIPDQWNKYVSGPALMFEIGLGLKNDEEIYPRLPVKLAVALQQNANVPVEFLDNLRFGLFARGALGTFLYKKVSLEPEKTIKYNFYGAVEVGVKAYIVGK